jgi:hypothetical protein
VRSPYTRCPRRREHDVHTPLHVLDPQQNPSLHTPLVHCALKVHAPPAAVCATHAPDMLQ